MRRSDGFTLTELVIAMAIMSFMLIVLLAGIVQLFHMYQAGLSIRNTQQNARSIADRLTKDARQGSASLENPNTSNPNVSNWCVPSTSQNEANPSGIIYYIKAVTVGGHNINQLVRRPYDRGVEPCTPGNYVGGSEEILSDDDVSIIGFNVPSGGDPHLASVNLVVASVYDLTSIQSPNSTNPSCPGGSGGQFCSLTKLNMSVMMRHQ